MANTSARSAGKGSVSGFDPATDRIAIIAGNGSMPLEIAIQMRSGGLDPLMIGIKGEADASRDVSVNYVSVLSFGQIGALFDLLEKHSIRHVLFAGGIVRRPDFKSMKLDMTTLKELPALLRIVMGGDDSVLGKIAQFLARHDIEVVGVREAAPGLLAEQGLIAGKPTRGKPGRDLSASIGLAWRGARAVGSLDAGQGCIVEDGRVVALEGAEGTDAMISRLAALRETGRLNPRPTHCVLAKVTKPGQDLRADLPAIGPATISAASAAGIGHIVVEAGKSVILERAALVETARKLGVQVHGQDDGSIPS